MAPHLRRPRNRWVYPPDMRARHEAITRQLRNRLIAHAMGQHDMKPSQVRAIALIFQTLYTDADPERPPDSQELHELAKRTGRPMRTSRLLAQLLGLRADTEEQRPGPKS
jgi:hypothetical protein